ncbi:hypothetical protein [Brevibacillus laterosporus]|uniref:hypothetical protein n=2 Tax=Brevibacillus laterosporus TaxID=1465 RepID=UPI00264D8BAC|nr:hypothetical protein [Brevibacillus laterosporus]MDN9011476.1 hypothetical protein [Brevibacillus laterosporus]MDO0942891.1 hypothetical protein [Brevibacillus laterosporus]
MDKVISMKESHDSEQITWLPLNRPPIGTAVIVFCKGCKKKHPVYDEDTNQIGWWWCFNKNRPYPVRD